jgi:hypothetical protein
MGTSGVKYKYDVTIAQVEEAIVNLKRRIASYVYPAYIYTLPEVDAVGGQARYTIPNKLTG